MSLIGCGNKQSTISKPIVVTCTPISLKEFYPTKISKPSFDSNKAILDSYGELLKSYSINTKKLLNLIELVKNQNKQCRGN